MRFDLSRYDKGKTKLRRKVVMSLATVVVFVTTYILILPAVTLEESAAEQMPGIDAGKKVEQPVDIEEADSSAADTAADKEGSEQSAEADSAGEADSPAVNDNNDTDVKGGSAGSGIGENDKESKTETEKGPEQKVLTASGDDYDVTVSFDEKAGIPDGVKLTTKEIEKDDPQYSGYYEEAETLTSKDAEIKEIRIIDISIVTEDGGNEIEPEAAVDVRIDYDKAMKVGKDEDLKIIHFAEPGSEVLEADAEGKGSKVTAVEFTTESFSSFATVKEQFTKNMEEGCIAYFSFDDESSGFSGAGATAARHGTNELRTGHSGNGLYLDQPNQQNLGFLTVTKDNGSSLLTGLDEFTVAYWVRPTENTCDGSHGNWAYYASPNGNQQNYLREHYVATSHQSGNVTSERFDNNGSRPAAAQGNGVTPTNEWHHVAVVYRDVTWMEDPNNARIVRTKRVTEIYIDGELIDSEDSTVDLSNMLGNNSIFQIGKANWEGGQGFRGYLDEFAVFNYPLAPDEIEMLRDEKGMIVLSPMNENGVLPGDPVSSNVTSTHYKNMTIDGNTVTGGDSLEYARMYIPVKYNSDGTATITLPSNEQLTTGFRVSDEEPAGTNHTITQDQNKYQWVLRGWVNIADENNDGNFEYYDVTDGPVTVTVSRDKLDVFYADWEAKEYDYTIRPEDRIETVDTSSFVKMGVWDYNELYNLNTSTAYKVDGDARFFQPRDSLESEEWYINHTVVNGGDFVQFVDNTDERNCWAYGTLGNNQDRGRVDENQWSNYSGNTPRFGITGEWGQPSSTHVLGDLFDTSNTPGSGVTYLGEANYLFSYDPDKKMYSYDSDDNGAVYNRSEQRFYVADERKDHSAYIWPWPDQTRTGFLPLNDYYDDLNYRNGTTNYWFGMSTEVKFWLPDVPGTGGNKIGSNNDNMIFYFRGDDDVWVYIDGKLALDIGGIHEPIEGQIDFSTGVIRVNTEQGPRTWNLSNMGIGAGQHTLNFYYVERGANASNCEIKFNLMPRWVLEPARVNTAKVKKTWSEDTPDALKEELEFKLREKNGDAAGDVVSTVGYEDGTFDASTGEWSYIWERLDPDKDYIVEETSDPAFTTTVESTVSEDGTYKYWAPSGYDDAAAFGTGTILLGNGIDGSGRLLKSSDGQNTDADIKYDIVADESVSNDVKWTVTDYSSQSMHFYLTNGSGKYLSIRNGSVSIVDSQANASSFYLGPTGDLNDANSNYRLAVTGSGDIGVAAKKGSDAAGTESTDRVHIYEYLDTKTKLFDHEVQNVYRHFPIQFKKVSIEDVSLGAEGLKGAVFSLYSSAPDEQSGEFPAGSLITKLTSRADGYLAADRDSIVSESGAVILDIPAGTYYLKEDKAPAGYVLKDDVIAFEVSSEGVLRFLQPTSMIDSKYVAAADVTIGGEPVQVPTGLLPNSTGAELPSAGGPGTTWMYLLGSLLTLLAGVTLAARRRMRV